MKRIALPLRSLFIVWVASACGPPPPSPVSPTVEEVKAELRDCRPSSATPEVGVFGLSIISDDYLMDARIFPLLSDLGVKWVRMEFHWSAIERNQGTYNWAYYDGIVHELANRHIRIQGIVTYLPAYETEATFAPGLDRYTRALVARYKIGGEFWKGKGLDGYGVQYWEVFNEPNFPGHGWLKPGADPLQAVPAYGRALGVVSKAVRDLDPNAFVLLGGISPQDSNFGKYLDQLYALEPGKCFDIFAYHPYGRTGQFPQTAQEFRAILEKHHDPAKPIWFNEFGTGLNSEQADVLRTVFAQKDAVPGFFYFTLRDLTPMGGERHGLVDYDFNQKPGYMVLKDLLKAGP